MNIKCCNQCPDRFVKTDENGKLTRCHATCERYQAERKKRDDINDKRNADTQKRIILDHKKPKVRKQGGR